MLADRFGEIAVTVLVVGNQAAEGRQYPERIGIVEGSETGRCRMRELKHEQLAARLQHALHRGERCWFIRDVAQTEADGHAVEARIGERQTFGIRLYVADALQEPCIDHAVATVAEHGAVDV